ncbi:MAG TPA: hypothetical protein PLW86_12660 [Rhodocyclaceae bacterium]|nr:hypothetical protein [Rhodocyclaceae bacterium]
MKSRQIVALIAGATLSYSALAADVGVSISVGQPGFYGRLDIGDYPPPALIYREPVLVVPRPVLAPVVYLRVPPGHRKHWARYCGHYGACAQRVYFVRDDWYAREYVPRYRHRHDEVERVVYTERYDHAPRIEAWKDGHEDRRGRGHGKGHGHGRDRD